MKSLIALSLVLGATVAQAPAFADEVILTTSPSAVVTSPSTIVTTTPSSVTTTTRSFSFLPGHNYVVVDPLTGERRGAFDVVSRTFDGHALVGGLVLADAASGQIVATVDGSNQIVEVASAPVFGTYLTKLQTRRGELDAIISDALTRGDITAARAGELRARLDQISMAYANGRVLTFGEAMALADSLNSVQQIVVPFAKSVAFTPLVGGTYVIAGREAVVIGNDIDARRLKIERRVDDEYKAGRLSAKQVSRLKQDLNEVNMMQARYTKNGSVNDSKMSKLSMELDKVSSKLDRDVAYINEKRGKIGIRVN